MSNNRAGTVSFTVRVVTVSPADIPDAPGGLLAPEPAVRTGALIGYARVSTSGQLLDRQQHALAEAGCLRVFADKLSGKDADRPELAACLDYLRPGDTLVVQAWPGYPGPWRKRSRFVTREGPRRSERRDRHRGTS